MNIKPLFHNIDFLKNVSLPENNQEIILRIRDCIINLPALNIVKNSKLLEETIVNISEFSKEKKDFLIFGTGGSNLGSKALINILQGSENLNIHFFDNIDPINFENSINKIDLKNSGFVFISKSGTTPETLSQFACLVEIFEQQNCLHLFFENTIIITENKNSPLANIAHTNNCKILYHEKDIGGRYSVFSNVGMVPAIISGLNVRKIHAGALEEIKRFSNYEILQIGQFFKYQNFFQNLNSSVVMTYTDSLHFFGKWYLQLWAESIGKDNKGITAIHAVGTTDQHSQMQLYLDGPKDKFFTFVTTNHSSKGFKLHDKTMKENDVKYLVGKTMGDLMQAEQRATIDTFKLNNICFREIYIEKINEHSIGKLMAFSIMETIAACMYFEVNPFNQPAVEQGKVLTRRYLS